MGFIAELSMLHALYYASLNLGTSRWMLASDVEIKICHRFVSPDMACFAFGNRSPTRQMAMTRGQTWSDSSDYEDSPLKRQSGSPLRPAPLSPASLLKAQKMFDAEHAGSREASISEVGSSGEREEEEKGETREGPPEQPCKPEMGTADARR
eukprot:scaffold261617_cov33-Prasinocladus_malaysianus.AAC.1